MAWVQILSRLHLASLCRGSSPQQDSLTCFFGKEKILRTSLGSCVKPVFVWRQSRWSVLNYLERLPADSLFLKEEFYYSIFTGFSLSHQTHQLFFLVLCFLGPVLVLKAVLLSFFFIPGGRNGCPGDGFCFWNQDLTISGILGCGQYFPKGTASALRLACCCLGPRVPLKFG